MNSLETMEKLQKAFEPARPLKNDLDSFLHHHPKKISALWKGFPQGIKKHQRFPQTDFGEHHFEEAGIFQDEEVHQKMKVIQFSMSTDPSSAPTEIHPHYGVLEQIASDRFILGIIKDGITIPSFPPRAPL